MDKKCNKCNQFKSLEEFNLCKSGKNGLYYTRKYCKECLAKQNKNYKESNKEEVTKSRRCYYYDRGGKEKGKEYKKNKRKNDHCYRLRCSVSRDVAMMLKKEGGRKNSSCLKFLPFTIIELEAHLEKLWESWMNWDNYGSYNRDKETWNIDHIISQSKLLYDSMEHPNFKKCWDLSNLRPLRAIDNIIKGNR